MQKRTKGILAGAGGAVVLVGVIVGVQLLDGDEGASAALATLPADAAEVEFVDRDALFEAAGHEDLEHGASEEDLKPLLEDWQSLPTGTPLFQYLRPMQDAVISELAVDWYASFFVAEGAPVAVYRIDDDIDLGDLADDFADSGYDEDDVRGHARFTAEVSDASQSGLVGDKYPVNVLRDVTIVEDEHLLIAGSEPGSVLAVLEGDADSLADNDSVADLFGEAGHVAYAQVRTGERFSCGGGRPLSAEEEEQLYGESGTAELGTPEGAGTFLVVDGDDLVPLTLLRFGSEEDAEDDAAARKDWLQGGVEPVTRQPNSDLFDVESVEVDGSVVRVEVDYGERGNSLALDMVRRNSGPGTCNP